MLLPLDLLVTRVAGRCPDRTAVEAEDGSLTYRQLESLAGCVRRRLADASVGPGDVVGILLPRSRVLPAALLGVLRAGAAYLPLDPVYPQARLDFMLRDAGARLVLSTGTRAPGFSPGIDVLGIDELVADTDAVLRSRSVTGGDAPGASVPDGLAYVIYTSGSTGVPKGVEIPHSALALFREAILERIGLGPEERVLATTTICFDISILELLVPLTVGATVVVAPAGAARDAAALLAALEGRRITMFQATPSAWRLMLDGGTRLPPIPKKLCGGEVLSRELAECLLAGGGELWNLYGPTEATVWSTAHRVDRDSGQVPIGIPLPGYTVVVADEHGASLGPGEEGEIWIGGDALARGYRNRAELTDERFVTNPRGASDSRRMYRTGDVGRWREDGLLEYVGRRDHQLKIDGYRVEPGEIEHALEQHPAIAGAYVTSEGNGGQLVAYVRESAPGAVTGTGLRTLLHKQVPLYMIPSRFVRLSEIPLTPSGKVDRSRLASSSAGALPESSAHRGPGSPVEQRLHLYWQELLGTSEFGIDDDYFALGGRSLAAARLFARIESEFGVRLPIAALLTAPTIAQLARAIEAGAASQSWEPLVCLQPEGSGTPFFLIHPLGGNVITYRVLAGHLGRERPIYGLQCTGLNGAEVPLASVEAMAELYLRQIRPLACEGPLLLGGSSFGGLIAYEMARQAAVAGRRVGLVAMLDTDFPDVPEWAAALYGGSPLFGARVYPLVQRVRGHSRAFAQLGLRRYWLEIVRRRSVTAPDVADDPRDAGERVPDVLSRVSLANQRAERLYVPRAYSGLVTLFRATDPRPTPDRSTRWRGVVAGGVEIVDVPGNHYTMRVEPHVRILAEVLTNRLRLAEAVA